MVPRNLVALETPIYVHPNKSCIQVILSSINRLHLSLSSLSYRHGFETGPNELFTHSLSTLALEYQASKLHALITFVKLRKRCAGDAITNTGEISHEPTATNAGYSRAGPFKHLVNVQTNPFKILIRHIQKHFWLHWARCLRKSGVTRI